MLDNNQPGFDVGADEPVLEIPDDPPKARLSAIDRRCSEVKGALDVLQKNVVGHQQFTSITNGIQERFDLLKKEVDALQIEVMKPARSWYKDAGVIVSLVAVLFSFGTAAASYQQISIQDRRAARGELRQLIQRMIALPKENMDLTKTYEKDASTSNILSGFINQENAVIARQAAEIIERIPNEVSANEYHAVALALLNSNVAEKVPTLVERGLKVAKDYSSELELLRLHGTVLILSGDAAKGRAKYQEALDLFNKYKMPYDPYVASSNAITEMNWASSEFGQGQCQQAEKLLNQAKARLDQMPMSPFAERLKQQEVSYEENLQKYRQHCKD